MRKTILTLVLAAMLVPGAAFAAYQVGDTPANWTLPSTDGENVSLYDYMGKVIFIAFWGAG